MQVTIHRTLNNKDMSIPGVSAELTFAGLNVTARAAHLHDILDVNELLLVATMRQFVCRYVSTSLYIEFTVSPPSECTDSRKCQGVVEVCI